MPGVYMEKQVGMCLFAVLQVRVQTLWASLQLCSEPASLSYLANLDLCIRASGGSVPPGFYLAGLGRAELM